eukprot:UN10260
MTGMCSIYDWFHPISTHSVSCIGTSTSRDD